MEFQIFICVERKTTWNVCLRLNMIKITTTTNEEKLQCFTIYWMNASVTISVVEMRIWPFETFCFSNSFFFLFVCFILRLNIETLGIVSFEKFEYESFLKKIILKQPQQRKKAKKMNNETICVLLFHWQVFNLILVRNLITLVVLGCYDFGLFSTRRQQTKPNYKNESNTRWLTEIKGNNNKK